MSNLLTEDQFVESADPSDSGPTMESMHNKSAWEYIYNALGSSQGEHWLNS